MAIAGAVGYTACTPGRTAHAGAKSAEKRQIAPDFKLKDADGKVVQLSDYRGKVVLLNFWATWCGPCKMEIPWFIDFERAKKDKGFEVLGVSMDEDGWNAVRPYVAEMHVNYRVVIGDDRTADSYGGLEALPTTFVLDRQGRVASTHIGVPTKKELENVIDELLAQPTTTRRSSTLALSPATLLGSRAVAGH